jgi:hypothetical protein
MLRAIGPPSADGDAAPGLPHPGGWPVTATRAASMAVPPAGAFDGLAAKTLFGAWWLDRVVALGIAGWPVGEGRRAWAGRCCG